MREDTPIAVGDTLVCIDTNAPINNNDGAHYLLALKGAIVTVKEICECGTFRASSGGIYRLKYFALQRRAKKQRVRVYMVTLKCGKCRVTEAYTQIGVWDNERIISMRQMFANEFENFECIENVVLMDSYEE